MPGVYVNRYTPRRGAYDGVEMIQLLGKKEELLALGIDAAVLTEHKPGRWNVRGTAEEMDGVVTLLEQKRNPKRMRTLVSGDYRPEMFFTTLVSMRVGDRVNRKLMGWHEIGITWNVLIQLMMQDGWCDLQSRMTEKGLQEAATCLGAIHDLRSMKGGKPGGKHRGGRPRRDKRNRVG